MDPYTIHGDVAVDDRGSLRFCNEFDMADVRRFYVVANHTAQFLRAWHAHRHESKYVYVAAGAAVVAAVQIDNWAEPDRDAHVHRFVLSAQKPTVLAIPAGFANGALTLQADTQIFYFSTATRNESAADDVRYAPYYWNPWRVEER
mgnify:CR=1|jgi:dTDP-4-dehydrorhamnose 3,5-epimerase-like enzyme